MPKVILILALFFFERGFSQTPRGFYLNHNNFSECKFTSEAIYFVNGNLILDKTDYEGNPIWSKVFNSSIRELNVVGDVIYFFQDQTLVKLDTAGNILWTRNFSTPECGTYTNLIAIIPSHNQLFVLTSAGFLDDPGGMIILDTLGNIINSWCDSTGNGDFFQNGFSSDDGKAWLTIGHHGITCGLYARFIKTDSLGSIDTSIPGINLQAGFRNNILDMIPMPDSSFLVVNNTQYLCTGLWSPWNYEIALTNLKADGTILWQKTYYSNRYMLFVNVQIVWEIFIFMDMPTMIQCQNFSHSFLILLAQLNIRRNGLML